MQWIEWNRRGLIPGPSEDKDAFLARVQAAQPVSEGAVELYGISPDWVEVIESNQGLMPWHGAVMMTDGSKTALQVRRQLPWGYDREELVAHELAHVGRCAFDEPLFEEFFAYRLSKKRWRRILGPVITRPREVWLLMAAMLVGPWVPIIPCTALVVGFTRLARRHWQLRRCVRWLYSKVGSRAWAVAYRLTDREIVLAAAGRLKSDCSPRWQMLSAVYGLEFSSRDQKD